MDSGDAQAEYETLKAEERRLRVEFKVLWWGRWLFGLIGLALVLFGQFWLGAACIAIGAGAWLRANHVFHGALRRHEARVTAWNERVSAPRQ